MVLDYYRTLIPIDRDYYLAQFSLKKNSGLYGLIFGSGHVLGIEKFLGTCWTLDKERGEANFDIDEDNIRPGQINLFTGQVGKSKKVESFEKELREKILGKELLSDKEVYLFTITNGFAVAIGKGVLKQLIKENRIERSNFEISSKICKKGALLKTIKLI